MYYTYHQTGVVPRDFFYRVYGWMAVGLAITAATSYALFSSVALFNAFFSNQILFFGVVIAQMAIAIGMSAGIQKISFETAAMLFVTYSILMGLTLSRVFAIYSLSAIVTAFAATSGMFAVTALYGYVTDADLSTLGSAALMVLFGIIIGMLVNMFMRNEILDYVITVVSVVVFSLLTAYDVQMLKRIASSMGGYNEMLQKVALIGALTLYLDFVNLFLSILKLLGKEKN